MATQTVLSEEVEKEEVKKMEDEKVCPTTKESVEEVTKPKEVSSEQKPEDEPVVELPPPAVVEKVEDKPVELPPTLDEKKTEDAPIVDKATPHEAVPAPDVTAEPTIEKEDIKSEATCVEPIEEKKPEEIEKVVDVPVSLPSEEIEKVVDAPVSSPADEIEKVVDEPVSSPAEEIEKVVDAPVSSPAEEIEKVVDEPVSSPAEEEKDETPKESPAKAVEPIEVKDAVAEGECKPQEAVSVAAEEKIEETPKIPADEVEDIKLAEKEETCAIEAKTEDTTIQVDEKHVDSNPIDQEKDTSVAAAPVVEEKILEKIEKQTPELPADEVEGTKLPCATESSEASGIQVEEKHVDSNPIGEATEEAKDTVEVTGESGVEPGKNETGVAEEKSVVAEELVPCEEKATEDVKGSVPVAEKATSRDVDLACDKASNEDETTKEVDEKIEKTVEAKLDQVDEKISEDKQGNEPEKTECIKDTEETKTYEDVPVKKQSFVKIMKQSLVKAKKAIIGKSQNPKTPASEPKASELKVDGDK